MVPTLQTLLDAALQSGYELPNLCHSGACGACTARLVEGQVDHLDWTLLDAAQREAGFALMCSSTPTSDIKVLSHQVR
jgi:ferredoxin